MLAGESNATTTEAFPGVTLVIVGAPGAAAGVVGSEGSSAFVVPALLVADKVQVYVLPLVSPLTVIGDAAPVLLPGAPPSIDVHETENDCVLPLSAPAVNATVIELSPPLALVITGAPGGAAGTTAGEAAEGPLVSSRMFVAVTVHVYVLPLVRPETAIGDETPSRLPDVPPLDDVHDAVNDAIAVPFVAPGVNATVIEPSPGVTLVIVGGLGATANAEPTPAASTNASAAPRTAAHRAVRNAPRSRTDPPDLRGRPWPPKPLSEARNFRLTQRPASSGTRLGMPRSGRAVNAYRGRKVNERMTTSTGCPRRAPGPGRARG